MLTKKDEEHLNRFCKTSVYCQKTFDFLIFLRTSIHISCKHGINCNAFCYPNLNILGNKTVLVSSDCTFFNITWFSGYCTYPASNYMFKVSNRNTRTWYEICSKLTIISHLVLAFLLYAGWECYDFSRQNKNV